MIFFFRTIDSRQFQRRDANKLRVASRRLLAAALLGSLAGCTSSSPVAVAPSDSSSRTARSTPAQNPATSPAIRTSSESALERWWSALAKSAQTSAGKSTPGANGAALQTKEMPLVAVDVAAVAARHPAWKLANALEKSRPPSLRFEAFSASPGSRIEIGSPSFDVNFRAPSDETAEGMSAGENGIFSAATSEEFFPDSQNAEAQAVAAGGLGVLEASAEEDQRESITEFLRLVTQRQSNWRNDYDAILKTALEEDVAAIRRSPLAPISPLLPAPEVQLEMTNLRLQLSRNIFATEQEIEAARARLDFLLNQWREMLHSQQQQRLLELQQLQVEEPKNARSEGFQQIARNLEAIQNAQQNARTATLQEHLARVEQDFGDEQARLAIVLPPSGVLPIATAPLGSADFEAGRTPESRALAALGLRGQAAFARTSSVRASSIAGITALPFSQAASSPDAKAARIRTLRTLAWQEAIKQIQMASRQAGWQWRASAPSKVSEKRSGVPVPDRTREVLQMLFGSAS